MNRKWVAFIVIGVLLMAYDVNHARLVFGNPENGIVDAAGFNSEWTAADFDSLISLAAVSGRHDATVKKNLFWEKNSQSIILRPDLELKSMGATTDGDGQAIITTIGTFALVTMPGQPELKLLHQTDITAEDWTIQNNVNLKENQGFVVYWDKYATPSGSSSNLKFSIGEEAGGGAFVYIEFFPREKTVVYFRPGENKEIEQWEKEIPANIKMTEGGLNFLVCFFVDNYILIGINGIEQLIAFQSVNYNTNNSIPYFTTDFSRFTIQASGSGVFGFKRLGYATSGSLSTPITFPGYVISEAPSKELKYIQPTGTTVTMETFAGGNDASGEDVSVDQTGREAIEKFGVYANVRLTGDGDTTPVLYRFRMYGAPSRSTASGSALEINGTIRTYEESWQGDQNGDFLGGNLSAVIRAKDVVGKYSNIYTTKAGLVTSYVTLANNASEVLRMVSCLDTKEIKRPTFGVYDLEINCQDITKRLRTNPNLVAETYDGRGWTDVDLMEHLGERHGVPIRCAAVSADTTVPASYHLLNDSGDDKNPNWQYGRGVMPWEFISRVRAFSGWILSPDTDSSNRGGLYFRPKPTSDDDADWTFDADTAVVTDVGYKSVDLYRTRFSIYGIAAADNQSYPNPSWNYKKGDILCGMGLHSSLEEEIGESRHLIIIDPTFTNWEGIGRYLLALYDYYTTEHASPVFRINNFEEYQTMHLYQQIAWTDSDAGIDGRYLITALNVQGDKFRATATVNTIVTATGLVEGIMKEEKRRQEKGMLDYNATVRGMEAVSKGDYVKLMQKSPAALRIFAYDSDDESYRADS
ncbi:MAG: hypothetical protein PHG61_07525 [Candidatus Marinimicrobia bacterium]|nr:hypothetical protein [Candidatus Neomarinimicrobiota bacterium]